MKKELRELCHGMGADQDSSDTDDFYDTLDLLMMFNNKYELRVDWK